MTKFFVALLVLISTSSFAHADPVMDRINKTQTIRCGFVSYTPASSKDLTTGEMVGYNVDMIEEAAKRMGLKVEWAAETNWPVMAADLKADKFDVACVTYWMNPRSALQMLNTDEVFYQPTFFATRADDTRFDKDISKINDPSVSIAVLDGDVPVEIARELYPKAKLVALPQMASFAQIFQEVANKRADVAITSKPDMDDFVKSNPGKLKLIMDQPVRLFPTAFQLLPGSTQVKNALDTAILEMQLDGTIEKILEKYATGPHDYYLIEKPYKKIPGKE